MSCALAHMFWARHSPDHSLHVLLSLHVHLVGLRLCPNGTAVRLDSVVPVLDVRAPSSGTETTRSLLFLFLFFKFLHPHPSWAVIVRAGEKLVFPGELDKSSSSVFVYICSLREVNSKHLLGVVLCENPDRGSVSGIVFCGFKLRCLFSPLVLPAEEKRGRKTRRCAALKWFWETV